MKERLVRQLRECLYQLLALTIIAESGVLHGYELREKLGRLLGATPSESTVYEMLKRLERMGLLESFWARSEYGPPRKYYRLRREAEGIVRELRREACRLLKLIAGSCEDANVNA